MARMGSKPRTTCCAYKWLRLLLSLTLRCACLRWQQMRDTGCECDVFVRGERGVLRVCANEEGWVIV